MVDNGQENYGAVSELLENSTGLKRILAQVDIVFSNSMIEAWWREFKNTYLFTHVVDSLDVVTRLAGYYVAEHNGVVGRAMFGGRTPDEVYHGRAVDLPQRLTEHRVAASKARVSWNRSRKCTKCSAPEELVPIQPHRTNDGVAA